MTEVNGKILDLEYKDTYKMLREKFKKDNRVDLVEKLDKIYAETKLARSKGPQTI